jgi:H+/Cl- antiporter ClcA
LLTGIFWNYSISKAGSIILLNGQIQSPLPLFTIGGAIGVLTGQLMNIIAPSTGLDLRLAALVGMARCFAGASRAMFASVVFALEITQRFNSLMPLLAGCATAFMVSALLMKSTIMTEKLVRRGHPNT